ncbi:MAG: MFS transporter, partial [Candidatus Actinomarinales bacterium]|nr:MFS transporter [Candidatus Actinomarinales bacterium]
MKKESKKNFNLLLTASAFSNLADGIAGFAYPWLFSLITRDPLLISLMTVLVTLPQLIFVLFAGVIADKFNRKSILIFTRIFQVILTSSFIFLIYFNLDFIPKNVPIVEPEFNR